MVAKGATRLLCDGQRYSVEIDSGPRFAARAAARTVATPPSQVSEGVKPRWLEKAARLEAMNSGDALGTTLTIHLVGQFIWHTGAACMTGVSRWHRRCRKLAAWKQERRSEPDPRGAVDVQAYKRRLLDLEDTLSGKVGRDSDRGRTQVVDTPADVGDASVTDEAASESFTEAELDAAVLQQVREALQRIADGTYGRCLVDGGPIATKRLDAVPWAPYCVKHQRLLRFTIEADAVVVLRF